MQDASVKHLEIRYGEMTVPTKLVGCWHRRYIRFSDGQEDTTTRVIWVQTLSGVGDIRVAEGRPDLKSLGGLEDCSKDELLALAEQDCFAGNTLYDKDTEPYPSASWPPEAYLFRYQPVITFPESGWMEWTEEGTCMIERAPSGAYEEDWRLQPGSRDFAIHLSMVSAPTKTSLYITGNHAIFARDRSETVPNDKTLMQLFEESGSNLDRLRQLLDCEFSYARRRSPSDRYIIELSTLPWREGQPLRCDWVDELTASSPVAEGDDGEAWKIESLWRP
jgi:hypothetical protein